MPSKHSPIVTPKNSVAPSHPLRKSNTPAKLAGSLLASSIAALLLAPAAQAATEYWKLDGLTSTWTSSNWGTISTGPFTTGWTAGSDAVFGANSLITYVTNTQVGDITVNDGFTVALTAAGTYNTGGGVRTFDVGAGSVLDFAAQGMSTAAGTGFIKSGAGIYYTANGNAFTGGFTLNAGTVVVGGINALGFGGALTINGGTIAANATRDLTGRYTAITVGGNFTLGGITTGVVTASGNAVATANLTFNAPMDLGAAGRTITLGGTGSYTLGGAISNSGGGLTVAATAGGTLVLSGASNYTGGTTLTSGTVSIAASNHLGAASSGLTFDGGTLQITGTALTALSTLGHTVQFNSGKTVGLDINAAGNTFTVDQALDQTTGGFTKLGAGKVILNQVNTYTGGTSINAGILQFNAATAIGGTGANVTVNSAGTAATGYAIDQAFLGRVVASSGGVVALAADSSNNLNLSAAGANLTAASLGATGAFTYSGALTPNGTTYRLGGGGGTLTVSSALTGAGNALLVGNNGTAAGTVVLTNANTYGGGTTILGDTASTLILANPTGAAITGNVTIGKPSAGGSGGTLQLGANDQLSTSSTITFGHAFSAQHAYFKLNGFSTSIAGLVNGTDLGGEVQNGSATTASTLTLAGTGTYTFGPLGGFHGTISNGAAAALSIVKTGVGTQTFTGVNTYTGTTTVNQGVLTLSTGGSLASTSAVTVATGATLNLSGAANNQLVGTTQTGTLNVSGTLAATTNLAHTLYFSTISLSGGTLANTFGSNTSGFGAFYVGANKTITANGTGNTISGTGVIGIGSGFALTLSTPLVGDALSVTGTIGQGANGTAGGLTKSGLGTLTLSGLNTYTGLTTVSGGTLVEGVTNALSTGAVTVNGATAILSLGAFSDSVGTVTLDGGGQINSSTGILTTTGTFEMKSGSASAILAGAVALNKTTTGTVTLSGVNTYSGGTAISGGVLNFSAATAIGGTGANVTVNSTGTAAAGYAIDQAFLGRIVATSAGVVALGASSANNLDFSATGANLTAASLGATGAFTYSGTLTPNGTTYRLGGGGGTLTVSTTLTGAGNALIVGLNGTAAGTVALTNANTYGGSTTLTGGTLALSGGDNRLPTTGGVIFGGNATFDVGTTTQTVNTLATSVGNFTQAITGSGGTINVASTGTMILVASGTGANQTSTMSIGNATVTFAPTSTVRLADQTSSANATTTATLTLNAGGTLNTGNLVLAFSDYTNGAGSPSGVATVTINNGATLKAKAVTMQSFDHQNNTKTATINLNTGGTLLLGTLSPGSTSSTAWTNSINFNGGTIQNYDASTNLVINALIGTTHPFTLGTAGTPTFAITAGRTGTISEPMVGAGSLTKIDTGTLILAAANTYSGDTLVSGGTLSLTNNLALQNSALDTSGAGVVSVAVTTPTFGGLAGSTALGSVITTGYGGVTSLTLNPGTGVTETYAGVIADGASGMTLKKTGLGTQILSGASTYTGDTTISGGTLRVSGSLTNSNVIVTAGTLSSGSTGTIAGAVTIGNGVGSADAILSPGASIGTLTAGAVSFDLDGAFKLEINTGTLATDLLTSAGSVALGDNVVALQPFDLGSATLTNSQSFTFIHADGGVTGTFLGLPNGASLTIGLTDFNISYTANDVTLVAVPEPGAVASLLGGLGLLLGLRRRKNL